MERRNIPTNPMRSWRARVGVSFAIVAIAVTVLAAPAETQETELRSQVLRWLETTCGVGNESGQPLSLQDLGSAAVPIFADAFDTGPDARTVNEVRDAAARRFVRIETLLRAEQSFGLNETDLAALRQTPRGEFVGQAVRDFTFTYADAALRAVSMLGGAEGRRFLQRVADDVTSPHTETARALLQDPRG